MPRVTAGDLEVHYSERGAGPPLVLLHGGLATAEIMWSPDHVARLAEGHRVLMPDSRGHGRTGNPAGGLTYPQMADDVAAFCAALSLERPVVVGYSDGAQIGLELGLRHPGVARALVLGGVVISTPPSYFEMLAGMGVMGAGDVDVAAMREAFGDSLFQRMVVDAHDNWRELLLEVSTLWTTVPAYSDAQLAGIRAPSLVICGDRDRNALDDAVRLYRALPHAELAVVPCAPHGAATKAMFWANVLDFLGRH
jgi:pimeloyl-ACP methyl ester carboxylesterase